MTLDEKIEAWRERMADEHESGVFKENPDGFTCAPYCNGDFLSSAYLAGARAESEVARLVGKIAALREMRHSLLLTYIDKSEALEKRLEALLDPAAGAK